MIKMEMMTEFLEMVIERDSRYDNHLDDEYIDVDDNDDDDVMIAEMMIMILMMMMMMMIMRLKKRMRMRRWRRSIDESCTGIDISFKRPSMSFHHLLNAL